MNELTQVAGYSAVKPGNPRASDHCVWAAKNSYIIMCGLMSTVMNMQFPSKLLPENTSYFQTPTL